MLLTSLRDIVPQQRIIWVSVNMAKVEKLWTRSWSVNKQCIHRGSYNMKNKWRQQAIFNKSLTPRNATDIQGKTSLCVEKCWVACC